MSIDIGTDGCESINMANGNFRYMLGTVLGFTDLDYAGRLNPMDLLAAVQRAERAMETGHGTEFVRPTVRANNWVDCGYPIDMIELRLSELRTIAKTAIRSGKPIRYG